jgi:hypothetical protein
MGEVSWFLGFKYLWENLPDGRLTVSITQTAKAEDIIETHGMSDCNPVDSPYRSGYTIDNIPDDGVPLENKEHLMKKYQSVVGGLLWVQRQTRPFISAVTHLLIRHTHKVLAYLNGTLDRGNRFTQGGVPVGANVTFPIRYGGYTDVSPSIYSKDFKGRGLFADYSTDCRAVKERKPPTTNEEDPPRVHVQILLIPTQP